MNYSLVTFYLQNKGYLDMRFNEFVAEDKSEKPKIRKYTKERPDGSVSTKYEVLDYMGKSVGRAFDDMKDAKDYLSANKFKLLAPWDK